MPICLPQSAFLEIPIQILIYRTVVKLNGASSSTTAWSPFPCLGEG